MVTRRGLAVMPFLVVAVAGLATLMFPPYHDRAYDWWAAGLGILGTLVLAAALWVIRPDHWAAGIPPLLFFAVVAVARDASGGAQSGVTPLILLPVLWIVMYGSVAELYLAAVSAGAVFIVPLIVVGAPAYDPYGWRPAVIWALVIAVICPTLQRGVQRLRDSMREQKRLAAQLEAVLRAATEHAIIATDLRGAITLFSQGAERMLGYRSADVAGVMSEVVVHDRVAPEAGGADTGVPTSFESMTGRVPPGGALTYNATFRRHDGGTLPVQLTTTRLLNHDDEHVGWIKVARDITEQETSRQQLEIAERRWRAMLDNMPDLTVLVVGSDLRYRVALGAGLQRQGWSSSLVGRSVVDVANAENLAVLEPLYRQALAGTCGRAEVVSSRMQLTTEVLAVPLPGDGNEPEALILARDVTQDRLQENELCTARDEARQLFDEAPHGAVLMTADGLISRANPALAALVGTTPDDLLGQPLVDSALADLLTRAELEVLLTGEEVRLTTEKTLHASSGLIVHAEVTAVVLTTVDQTTGSILATVVDVSERKRFEQQLAHLADHDPLTGLANRRKFDTELTAHLERCRRYGAQGAIIMLDLDNFKLINDTLGHGAGDQLIISVASVLRNRLRTSDVVARLGGDEFAVLLPVIDRAGALTVAGDLVQLIRGTVCVLDGTQPRTVTTSLGVVLIQDPEVTPSDLLSTADMTMYDAKEAGRDRYVLHDTTEYAVPRSGARIAWAARIETALRNGDFRVHAQPIQDVVTGAIIGAELLIRMIDDEGNLILPGRFLYVAERSSLIVGIDSFMLTEAARVLATLRDIDPDFTISVNLSGRNVGHPVISALIPRLIAEYDFNPNNLILEITETAAVSDIETARTFAGQLRELGCRFALDDFGAGFGSFYYLKHLVFDFVKIDGEFVAKSPSTPADQLIIRSIVDIARGLGKKTVAEFVADGDILATIAALGVDRAQGYHIGRPGPVEDLIGHFTAASPSARPTPLPAPRAVVELAGSSVPPAGVPPIG